MEYFNNRLCVALGADCAVAVSRDGYASVTVLGKYKCREARFTVDWHFRRGQGTGVEKAIKALLLTPSISEFVAYGDPAIKDSTEVLKDGGANPKPFPQQSSQ